MRRPARRLLATALLCCGLAVPAAAREPASHDLLIVPGERVGPIDATMTEQSLEAMLPAGSVRRDLFTIEDGFAICGTVVFVDTVDELFVRWANGPAEYDEYSDETLARCLAEPAMERPVAIMIRRPFVGPAQRWRTAEGIGIGTTLNALADIIGGAVFASVCPCGFGGTVYPDQAGLPAHLSFWIDFPNDVEDRLAGYVKPEMDFELSSADIPEDMRHEFVIDRIDVTIRAPDG